MFCSISNKSFTAVIHTFESNYFFANISKHYKTGLRWAIAMPLHQVYFCTCIYSCNKVLLRKYGKILSYLDLSVITVCYEQKKDSLFCKQIDKKTLVNFANTATTIT